MQEILLKKLRAAIKDMPCNSLSRVYPYQLQKWVGVSGDELMEFIEGLLEENLMDEKYDFRCDCGNECTVYEQTLLENRYECPECEKKYSNEKIVNKGDVLYEINKSAVMEYNRDSVDPKSRIRKIIEYEKRKKEEEIMQSGYAHENISQRENKMKVFLSYSHEDEEYKEKLDKHLASLRRNKKIDTWNDRKLLPGSKLDETIKEQLRQSDIIILIVSSSFIDSDYCYGIEMQEAIKRAKNGECKIIPVIARSCMWDDTPFKDFLVLPTDGKAISQYKDEDEAYTEIARGVKRIMEEIEQKNDK